MCALAGYGARVSTRAPSPAETPIPPRLVGTPGLVPVGTAERAVVRISIRASIGAARVGLVAIAPARHGFRFLLRCGDFGLLGCARRRTRFRGGRRRGGGLCRRSRLLGRSPQALGIEIGPGLFLA